MFDWHYLVLTELYNSIYEKYMLSVIFGEAQGDLQLRKGSVQLQSWGRGGEGYKYAHSLRSKNQFHCVALAALVCTHARFPVVEGIAILHVLQVVVGTYIAHLSLNLLSSSSMHFFRSKKQERLLEARQGRPCMSLAVIGPLTGVKSLINGFGLKDQGPRAR